MFVLDIWLVCFDYYMNEFTWLEGCSKVCVCYLDALLNRTPMFDWCVVHEVSKNKHHKDTYSEKIDYVFKF